MIGASGEPTGLRRGLTLLVADAFFMEILDATVIAPAAPLIAEDLGVPAVDVNIAISSYLVTVAVLIPISGWAADRSGSGGCSATDGREWQLNRLHPVSKSRIPAGVAGTTRTCARPSSLPDAR